MRATPLVTAAALLLLSGCATGDRAVARAAQDVGTALAAGDHARACALLAPLTRAELESSEQQPCPEALAAQELVAADEVSRVERYGRQGRVRVRGRDGGSDTWFLSRFGDRWLLVAAGCEPRGGDLPYDCDVEGA